MAIFGLELLLLHHIGERKLSNNFFGTIVSFHILFIYPIIFYFFYFFSDLLNFSFISSQNILVLLIAFLSNVAIMLFGFYKLSQKNLKLYISSIVFKPLLQLILILLNIFNIFESSILEIIVYPMILTFLIHLFFIVKSMKFNFNREFFIEWVKIISQGKWIYISSIIFLLNSKGIIIITNKYGTIKNVGVLFIALSALDIISYVSNAFGDITQIDMASLKLEKKYDKFIKEYRHILLVNIFIGLLSVPFTYFIFPFINIDFTYSFYIYIVILPAFILISASKMVSVYFISINKAHYGTISVIVTFITILISALFLVEKYGVLGAGISVAIGYTVSCIVDFSLIARVDGFNNMVRVFYGKTNE